MKAAPLFVAIVAALAGCATSGEEVPTPSGGTMHQAKCNGSPNECLKSAAKVCKGKYQVLDSSSNSGGLIADIIPGPITWYRMSYSCGATDGRLPTFPFRGQQYTPAPVIYAPQASPTMRTTNCNRYGNNVSCTTF